MCRQHFKAMQWFVWTNLDLNKKWRPCWKISLPLIHARGPMAVLIGRWISWDPVSRLTLPESNRGGWFVAPTIVVDLPDTSRYYAFKTFVFRTSRVSKLIWGYCIFFTIFSAAQFSTAGNPLIMRFMGPVLLSKIIIFRIIVWSVAGAESSILELLILPNVEGSLQAFCIIEMRLGGRKNHLLFTDMSVKGKGGFNPSP